jgi:molecular chaperone HscB
MQALGTAKNECWRCRADTGGGLACVRCEAVQPIPSGADLFTVLGLPRRLGLDRADLEHRYHALSRAVHPDRHQTASEAERGRSLAASAMLNRAYRTLRDPVARGRYWLELHGRRLGGDGPQVPAEIAAEVFETQEKLEEFRGTADGNEALRGEVRALHDGLAARLEGLREALVDSYFGWDGQGTAPFEELARRLAEIGYLRTLLGDIEEALGEERGTHHRH